MFQKILVATDGSESGVRAVSFAIALAREHEATLAICNAVDAAAAIASCASPYGGIDAGRLIEDLDDAAVAILERASEAAARAGVPATTVVLSGRAAEAIVACAAARQADAIVIGTAAKRGIERLFLGSTAADVLRRSTTPTFVISRCAPPDRATFRRILVAVDDSEPSDAALQFAMDFAEAERGTLVLCAVVDTRDLFDANSAYGSDPKRLLDDRRFAANDLIEKRAASVRARGLEHEIALVDGEPARAIVATTKLHGAGAIVIGTHGRRGLQHMLLGSVAEAVVRDAAVPVAVIRTEPVAATRR